MEINHTGVFPEGLPVIHEMELLAQCFSPLRFWVDIKKKKNIVAAEQDFVGSEVKSQRGTQT